MAVLDIDDKTFVVHIAILVELIIIPIYLFYKTSVALLISIKISIKYFNFLNFFSSDSVVNLPKYIRMNDYSINLLEDKQPPYNLIYSQELVE